MKRNLPWLILLVSFAILTGCEPADDGYYEETAINSLDELSQTIGELQSCSFTLQTDIVERKEGELTDRNRLHDVYMSGYDKMYVYSRGDSIRRGFWLNAGQFAMFDFNKNRYQIKESPPTIIEAIDSAHSKYGIDFPAADFFYPSLTDDIITYFDTIIYMGVRDFNGMACREINAKNAKNNVYILMEDSSHLPVQLEMYGLGDREGETYVSTFSNWRVNPSLPDGLFVFAPNKNSVEAPLFKK